VALKTIAKSCLIYDEPGGKQIVVETTFRPLPPRKLSTAQQLEIALRVRDSGGEIPLGLIDKLRARLRAERQSSPERKSRRAAKPKRRVR
jgi:hypothetical protein